MRGTKILLLDEATSSLDAATDLAIQSTLRHDNAPRYDESSPDHETLLMAASVARSEGVTVMSITHRLALIADSDLVIVIDGGRVCESGSPQELLARSDSALSRLIASHNVWPQSY